MAQQGRKPERAFKDVSLQSKADWKKGLTIPLVATIVNPRDKDSVVDGQSVNLWKKGNKTELASVDGKISYDIPIDGPGNWPIEIEMFDAEGTRINFNRVVSVVEEKHEKTHHEVYLFVESQRTTRGYRISAIVRDEDNHEVHDRDIDVHTAHPDNAVDYHFKTHHGHGSVLVAFADNANTPLIVTGAGKSYTIYIGQ